MSVVRGLPGRLPEGEAVLWQGAPEWRSLARTMCHVRGVAAYLGVVLAGTAAVSVMEGDPAATTALTVLPLAAASLLVLGFLLGLALLVARSTEYTLTTHRLVLRMGVALPATMAIPHRAIARASVLLHRDGTGDVPVETKPAYPVALRRVWPHARPWHVMRAQPMLRGVRNAGQVAELLVRTLVAAESERRRDSGAAGAPPERPRTLALSPVG